MPKSFFILSGSFRPGNSTSILFSQQIADKKMQAGLTGGFGLNLTKMGTSKMDKNGVGTILNVGGTLHKSFKNSLYDKFLSSISFKKYKKLLS